MSAISSAVPDDGPLPTRRPRDVSGLPTGELLGVVVDCGYKGEPWEELARRLVTRAMADLERSIRTGTIYRRCRRAGYKIAACGALQRWPMCADIAAEAVEDCLTHFKDRVLPAGGWDPDLGSLEVFFSACCIPHVANRWRLHLRQLPAYAIELDSLDEPGQAGVLALVADPPRDPAHVVELRDLLSRAAAPIDFDDRLAFVLLAQGWSPAKIAEELGITRNTLDARISRARKAARARRTP